MYEDYLCSILYRLQSKTFDDVALEFSLIQATTLLTWGELFSLGGHNGTRLDCETDSCVSIFATPPNTTQDISNQLFIVLERLQRFLL